MSVLNRALTAATDGLFTPLTWLPPVAGLALAGAVTALLALLVVRATSNPARIRAAKNGMYAGLLEMRLFNDDIRAVFRATGDVLASNARYLAASLVPILWLVVPFGLLFTHLEAFYAYGGLTPQAPALLVAHLRPGVSPAAAALTLEAPAGLRVLTPAVAFPATQTVMWTLGLESAGHYAVTIHAGGDELTKTITVSDAVGRRSPVRPADGFWDEVAYPSEPPLPAGSPVDRLSVSYPDRAITIGGWPAPWFVIYGAFTILCGLVLARLLHVEI